MNEIVNSESSLLQRKYARSETHCTFEIGVIRKMKTVNFSGFDPVKTTENGTDSLREKAGSSTVKSRKLPKLDDFQHEHFHHWDASAHLALSLRYDSHPRALGVLRNSSGDLLKTLGENLRCDRSNDLIPFQEIFFQRFD